MNQVFLSGQSNLPLAKKVARHLKLPLGKITIRNFSDGEKYINIEENLKGKEVFVFQSGSSPANENLVELLLILDAAKRLKPNKITAIIPFYPYRRQERKVEKGEPISAQMVARFLKISGVNKVVALDLHHPIIKSYLKIPVKEILPLSLFAQYFKKKSLKNFIVLAPDEGSIKRSNKFAVLLKLPLVTMKKKRAIHDHVTGVEFRSAKGVNLEIVGKNVIIIDDEINTAGTLIENVRFLKKQRVNDVYFAATHAVLSGPAIKRLKNSPLKEVIVTDSILLSSEKKIAKIKVLSVAQLIARAVR